MEATIHLRLDDYLDEETQKRAVRIHVTNTGDAAINNISFKFVYDYEASQDVSSEFGGIPSEEVGGCIGFAATSNEPKGPLAAGRDRSYLFPSCTMKMLISLVQSLSPENYRVAIILDEKEAVAFSGECFGEFVERRFPE